MELVGSSKLTTYLGKPILVREHRTSSLDRIATHGACHRCHTRTVEHQRQQTAQHGEFEAIPKSFSGNPGGRPKGQSLTAELRRQAQEGNTAEEIARVVIKGALSGKIEFLRLMFDRVDGLLTKPVSLENKDVDLNSLSDKDLLAIVLAKDEVT